MPVSEIIATYQELGIGGILIVVVVFVGRYLMKQNKACYDSYQQHVDDHKEEIKYLNERVLNVLDQNTKAMVELQKTINHLDSSMRGCAFHDPKRVIQ